MDTASNTGSAEPLATAAVDLDMRQWKESQTYQAEVPLEADGVTTASAVANICWHKLDDFATLHFQKISPNRLTTLHMSLMVEQYIDPLP